MPHIRLSATKHKQLPGQTRGDYWKSKVKRRPCNRRHKILVKGKTYSKCSRIQNYQSTSISKVGINYKPQDQDVLSGYPIDIKIEVKLITKTHTTNWRQSEFEFKFSLVYFISISLSKKKHPPPKKTKQNKTKKKKNFIDKGDVVGYFPAGSRGRVECFPWLRIINVLHGFAAGSTFIGNIFMSNNSILIMS